MTAIKAAGIAPENHLYYEENYLNIGIDRLPTEDYTVEYMAMYRPVLVADAAKSTSTTVAYAKDADGNLLEAYEVFGTSPVTTDYGSSTRGVDAIGWYSSHSQKRDADSGWDSTRGSIHWYFDNHFWGTHNTYALTNYTLAFSGNAFQQNDVIRVYGITLDETYNESTSVTTAVFGLYRDAVKYGDTSADPQTTECLTAKTRYYTEFTSACQFYLSSARPTDFYGVRVYDKVLTDAEKRQNRAVDLILYYGLDVSSVRDDEDAMASLYTLLVGETFLTDASSKAAKAASLQFAIDRENLANDFSEKYAAQENLTALFTTFAPGSINLTAGTWTDLIGGKTAKLGNASKGYWRMGENGSVGFDIFYGTTDANGAFVAESPFNNYATNGTRLDFGIAMLPKDDFTVEFVTQVNPVYVADAKGNKIGETYLMGSVPGSQQYGAAAYGAVYQLGYFAGFTTHRDAIHSNYTGRGAIIWTTSARASNWEASTQISGWNNSGTKNTAAFDARVYMPNGSVHTYTIQRDEFDDPDAEDYRGATYTIYRDAVQYATSTLTKAAMDAAKSRNTSYQPVNYATDDTGYFYLGERISTEFYTVRIYNKALTEAEKRQNRAVDVIYYYGLEIRDETWKSEDAMQDIYTALCDEPFLTDASAKAAKKHELQLIVSGSSLKREMLSLYARPESMTHLYTVYSTDSVDLTNGKWADLLSDSTATLGDVYHWKHGEHGGVGFNIFCGNMEDTDGDGYKETFNKELVVGQNCHNTGIRLDFGIDQLPKDDFTVDYLAMYKPVYVYDADEVDKIARDKNGNKIEVYNCDVTATAWHYNYEIDQLGWFTSIASALDGQDQQGWGGKTRGATHWLFNNPDWYCGNFDSWLGADWNAETGGLAASGNPYHTFGEIHSYAITLDETLTVTDGARVTSAVFSLYRDAAIYGSSAHTTANNPDGVELKDIEQNGYFDIEQEWFDIKTTETGEWISRSFWLSSTRPTDFYTVRIYDVALTDDEKAQNLFVDMLYYYNVEIPDALKGNAEAMTKLAAATDHLGFATDASAKAAYKALIETEIEGLYKKVEVSFGNKTIDTLKTMEDTLTLPQVCDGKLVIGWKVKGTAQKYAPGTEIDVTDDVALEPTLFTVPETRLVPTIKVASSADDLAIRFTAELYRADYLALRALYGAENIHLGMLITPDYYVQKAGGVFTREALEAMVQREGSASGAAYVQIDADGFYTVGQKVLTISGSVYNFSKSTFDNNPAFAAVAFMDVDTDGDGVIDLTFYGNYNPNASAKVKENMMLAQGSMTDTQKGWIDSLLSRFGA